MFSGVLQPSGHHTADCSRPYDCNSRHEQQPPAVHNSTSMKLLYTSDLRRLEGGIAKTPGSPR
ncbi:MAG: hypothetical protein ABIZ49_05915, partial [Opitutaceae bacterium]